MENKNSSKNQKGGGAALIVVGILLLVCAFGFHNLTNLSRGVRVSTYAEGNLLSEGTALGSSQGGLFVFLFWISLIVGIVFVVSGIVSLASGGEDYESSTLSTQKLHNVFACPKCGEINPLNLSYCKYCNTRLNKKKDTAQAQSWICPGCGKENMSYVGTCGCGKQKP